MFPHREESAAVLRATADAAFAYLDDLRQLSAHMEKPSGMMLGSRMHIETDERGGRAVGSRVRMAGTLLGIPLALEQVVTQREPPLRKAWRTLEANLLVIGPYQLGFTLEPDGGKTRLRVRIDYKLPAKGAARWLGWLFGRTYARWCTGRVAKDAASHFAR
jgi:hypothetical protein